MQKWLSSVPILLLSALVTIVSLQAGCGDGEDDDCPSSRSSTCNHSSAGTFLDKVNPFD